MKVRPNVWKAAVIVLVAPWQSAYGATGQITAADFRFQIRPILSKNCFSCQGPDEGHRQAKLRLDEREVATELGAIVPGAPDDSELIRRITSNDPEEHMPPIKTGRHLTSAEIDMLRSWILSGARYSKHWSYVPPARPALPKVSSPK